MMPTTTGSPHAGSQRVLFMGTPEIAIPTLRALVAMPDIAVVAVVTRRDQPVGRGQTLTPPPVKRAVQDLGLPVLQPGSLKRAEAQALLASYAPDVIVVFAFGQILPPAVLALPPHGCLNIHTSLLPRYRGAAPITTALLMGDAVTGTTIMLMAEGLDTGPILAQAELTINPAETTATLTDRLAAQGADLLTATLPRWLAGEITPQSQDESAATMTRLIRKDDGIIDWTRSAAEIDRQVRAYTPWPGTSTTWRGQPLKILAAQVAGDPPLPIPETPGSVVTWGQGKAMRMGVVCGAGTVLTLETIQLPGKRALPALEVVRGYPALGSARLPS